MAKFAIQIDTEHAVLFLTDASPGWTVPPNTGAAVVTNTDDCMAFWVLHYVDGTSLVTVSDDDVPNTGYHWFSGSIHAASGVLALSDSSNFVYLNIPVPAGRVAVNVYAEDERHPSWV